MVLANMAQFGAIFGGGRDSSGRGGNAIVMLIIALLAPLAAMLVQMAVSRGREYMADASGAEISNDPQALASALGKLEQYNQSKPMQATPQTAHMFTVNPLHGGGLAKLFSTHPPIGERIARLREMGGPALGDGRKYNDAKLPSGPPPVPPEAGGSPAFNNRQAGKRNDSANAGGKIDWS